MSLTPLPKDRTLEEVAEALGMSTRWIRDRIREGKEGKGPAVEHIRYGHKIRFTAEQVEKLRASHVEQAPIAEQPVTTGRKKKSA